MRNPCLGRVALSLTQSHHARFQRFRARLCPISERSNLGSNPFSTTAWASLLRGAVCFGIYRVLLLSGYNWAQSDEILLFPVLSP